MEHSSSFSHDNRQFLQHIDKGEGKDFCLHIQSERVPLILWAHQKHEKKKIVINYWLFEWMNGIFMQIIAIVRWRNSKKAKTFCELLEQKLQNGIYMRRWELRIAKWECLWVFYATCYMNGTIFRHGILDICCGGENHGDNKANWIFFIFHTT